MPTRQQIQNMLFTMNVRDLREISKQFNVPVTKQSGGYKNKERMVYDLVGGVGLDDPRKRVAVLMQARARGAAVRHKGRFTEMLPAQAQEISNKINNWYDCPAELPKDHPPCWLVDGGFGSVYISKINDLPKFMQDELTTIEPTNKIAIKMSTWHELEVGGAISVDKELLHEIVIARYLSAPNFDGRNYFSKLHKAFKINSAEQVNISYLIMEYLPNSLKDIIYGSSRELEHPPPDPVQLCIYTMIQLFNAIRALHKVHFVHRDLKPDNIMFDKNNHLKLIDFGLTRYINSSIPPGVLNTWRAAGDREYMAPEVHAEKFEGNKQKCDWWSIGCILIEILLNRSKPRVNQSELHNHKSLFTLMAEKKLKGECEQWTCKGEVMQEIYDHCHEKKLFNPSPPHPNKDSIIRKIVYKELTPLTVQVNAILEIAFRLLIHEPDRRWDFDKIQTNYHVQFNQHRPPEVVGVAPVVLGAPVPPHNWTHVKSTNDNTWNMIRIQ